MIDAVQMRTAFALVWCAAFAGLAACPPEAQALDFEDEIFGTRYPEPAHAPPVEGSAEWANLIVGRFAGDEGWGTEFVTDGKGDPEAVRLFLPSPLKRADEGAGNVGAAADETVLPLSPPGYVNRFKTIGFGKDVDGKVAFRFVDVVWNTARDNETGGPQFDILFRTRDMEEPAENAQCAPESRDCPTPPSKEEVARRLAAKPPKCFLPSGSVPVAEKATPETGLFNLAAGPETDAADPAVIYGTYDDEIVFLGVALSLETLQLAVDEGVLGERLSWPVSQPSQYRYAWWPRTVALEYRDEQNRFALSLEDFSERKVRTSCK